MSATIVQPPLSPAEEHALRVYCHGSRRSRRPPRSVDLDRLEARGFLEYVGGRPRVTELGILADEVQLHPKVCTCTPCTRYRELSRRRRPAKRAA